MRCRAVTVCCTECCGADSGALRGCNGWRHYIGTRLRRLDAVEVRAGIAEAERERVLVRRGRLDHDGRQAHHGATGADFLRCLRIALVVRAECLAVVVPHPRALSAVDEREFRWTGQPRGADTDRLEQMLHEQRAVATLTDHTQHRRLARSADHHRVLMLQLVLLALHLETGLCVPAQRLRVRVVDSDARVIDTAHREVGTYYNVVATACVDYLDDVTDVH